MDLCGCVDNPNDHHNPSSTILPEYLTHIYCKPIAYDHAYSKMYDLLPIANISMVTST